MKVLIVEDDSIIALSLKRVVSQWGYQVVDVCASATAALDAYLFYRPDAIIMDILLEGPETGIDATRKIKKVGEVPVIYLTGNSNAAFRNDAASTQPAAFLVKPLDKDQLKEILNTIERELLTTP